MNRRGLKVVVGVLAASLVAGLVYVFASAMSPSERRQAQGAPIIDVSVVGDGEYRHFVSRNGPIFVFRPTAANWQDLRVFDGEVQDPRFTNYYPELGVFIYYGFSTLHGCLLRIDDQPAIRQAEI